jgi:hypothetical protein
MFWAIMIPLIIITIAAIVIGEERFNRWCNQLKCKHEYRCLDDDGNIDNENPTQIVCVKCGRDGMKENKE